MCGIVGLFANDGQIAESSLERGMDCLKHRGPDGQRFWLSPNRRVALGHTRLSIIDLNHGEQPISNHDQTLHIIVNGEFYDFERIQSDLRRWGYKFKTNSDSEIALHLYSEFGTQCLHHLRGELSRAAHNAGYKVVLTGEGSDEIFGGYVHFRQDMLLYNQQGQNEQTIKFLLEELKLKNQVSVGLLLAEGNSSQALNSVQRLLGFVPSWMQASAEAYLRSLPLYSTEFIAKFSQKDVYRIFFNSLP